ncbi:MAG TPA: ThuA domain-containing protein [Gemmataceae bacterium]|jgi:type 1 glutamine amidotransferase
MFKHLASFIVIAAAVLPALADDKPAEKIRVILIDGQNNHNWRATTPLMKKELESCGRFTVDVASNLSPQDQAKGPSPTANVQFPPDLGKYDVLVSNYNGAPWPKEFQKDLEDRLREGKIGLVIVHAANNSFGSWTEYNRMIGMGWRSNDFGDRLTLDESGKEVRVPKGKGPGAGHGAYRPFLVTVRDGEHPITRGMPREWMHAGDELYHGMRGPIENVHLLATAYDDKSKDQHGTGEHEPMMWTVAYGKGRVFHTPMGHDERSMRCLGFVATLERGTEWAATGRVTLPLPENFPTADKTSSLPAK